ncbi:MAG: hypothetical protein CM1200mP2_46480 [Planctomycetaceae bacterium]|nr:MAG: hypothetical protein CM1200mP2_46480 [Planctomycetaceae bacterium]
MWQAGDQCHAGVGQATAAGDVEFGQWWGTVDEVAESPVGNTCAGKHQVLEFRESV